MCYGMVLSGGGQPHLKATKGVSVDVLPTTVDHPPPAVRQLRLPKSHVKYNQSDKCDLPVGANVGSKCRQNRSTVLKLAGDVGDCVCITI